MIVVSDAEFDTLDAPLANEIAKSVFDLQQVKVRHHGYEKMSISFQQMADQTFPLWDIQCNQIESLVEWKRALALDYSNGMIIVA